MRHPGYQAGHRRSDVRSSSREPRLTHVDSSSLYGPHQSRFARYLERRELRRPDPGARELRRRLLVGLRGSVIEVGAGDGRSFEHYPPEVSRLVAVEPDAAARAAAAERARGARMPIEIVDGLAEHSRPRTDPSTPRSSWACSAASPIPCRHCENYAGSPRRAASSDSGSTSARNVLFRGVQRAADRLFWTRSLGGCETTRDTEAAIRTAGYEIETLERGFHSSSLLTITSAPYVLGIARS